jgi:hypothetical protein
MYVKLYFSDITKDPDNHHLNKYTHTSIIFLIGIICNAVVVCYNQQIPVRIRNIKISNTIHLTYQWTMIITCNHFIE